MIDCKFENGNQAHLRHTVVSCIVVKDGQVLMGKRALSLTEGGKWNLMSGYMDRDETAEQTARREIMEESGWEVDNIRLLRIDDNPYRRNDERQNVVFVFISDGKKQTGEKDWENDEVRWFDLDNLPPEDEMAFDHADSIELYKAYLEHSFDLPLIGSKLPK